LEKLARQHQDAITKLKLVPNLRYREENYMKLGIKPKNWLLSAHIAFAALWTGTVLSMVLIAFRNRNTFNGDELHALNSIINLLDDFIVIPSSIGSVLTATFLCWFTNYGFFKFYWVIVKWILTVMLMLFGTFWLFPWANAATSISDAERLQAFENPLYLFDIKGVLIGCTVQVLCLVVIIAISVLKPWGRRNVKIKGQSEAISSNG
jgi:hypothetical protein